MKRWTLSDLAEFGNIYDGKTINLHGTTYKCHDVNTWNGSVMLEDIGLQPKRLPILDITNQWCNDNFKQILWIQEQTLADDAHIEFDIIENDVEHVSIIIEEIDAIQSIYDKKTGIEHRTII